MGKQLPPLLKPTSLAHALSRRTVGVSLSGKESDSTTIEFILSVSTWIVFIRTNRQQHKITKSNENQYYLPYKQWTSEHEKIVVAILHVDEIT